MRCPTSLNIPLCCRNGGKTSTTDIDLEIRNFQKAGKLLADVWSERVIDNFPVFAEYILPGSNTRTKGGKNNLDQAQDGVVDLHLDQLVAQT